MTYLPQLHRILVEGAERLERAEPAAEGDSVVKSASRVGRVAVVVRQLRGRRLFIWVVLAVLVAGSTAAAVGVFGSTASAPPSGSLSTAGAGSAFAATSYRIAVTPNLNGGAVGWCVQDVLRYRQGSSGGGGCDGIQLRDKPIIAAGGGFSADGGPSTYVVTTDLYFMTAPQVAAVRVSRTLTIRTRADKQLPDGYRIAVVIHQAKAHGVSNPSRPNPFRAVPLNAAGQALPMHWPGFVGATPQVRLYTAAHRALSDQAAYWQPQPTRGVGPQPKVHEAPAAACEIYTRSLAGVHLFFGEVVQHVRGIPQLTGKTYLSCANTQFGYAGYGYVSAILLDSQHPGTKPELLPDSHPVAGNPAAVNEPDTQSGPIHPITARRVGDAWLVVESSAPLTDRLRVLNRLTTCIRVAGAQCPPPSNR